MRNLMALELLTGWHPQASFLPLSLSMACSFLVIGDPALDCELLLFSGYPRATETQLLSVKLLTGDHVVLHPAMRTQISTVC